MLPTLVTWATHFIEARTTALHVQLVTELYLYRLRIFNKIEVSRLDSTLSLFVIIFVLHTLSWCQISGKNSDCLQDHTNRDFECREDLTVIKQHSISRGLKYSDFFRDHLPQHSGNVREEFILWT